mmetsp:Transcript_4445/g.6649  ORF Transcript_4445/g.6649 Transcript_4445/m.6649 type:complete len:269 (-) Transcript_4445:89-895(-)
MIIQILGFLATLASIALNLSPLYDIQVLATKGSEGIEDMSFIPFVAMYCTSSLWLLLAYHRSNIFPLGATCLVNNIVNFLACFNFLRIARGESKTKGIKLFVLGAALCQMLGYWVVLQDWTHPDASSMRWLDMRLGAVCAVVNTVMLVTPLLGVLKAMQSRSTKGLSWNLTWSSGVCSLLWLVLAVLESDFWMGLPNATGLVSAALQAMAFLAFATRDDKYPYRPGQKALPSRTTKPVKGMIEFWRSNEPRLLDSSDDGITDDSLHNL